MRPYYDDGRGIVIYHGDALEVLPTLETGSAGLLLTDPPYGINYRSSHGATWDGQAIANDEDTSVRDQVLELCRRINTGPVLCFGSWKAAPPNGAHTALVWDKGPAFGMGNLQIPWKPSWDLVFVSGTGNWLGPRDEGVLRGHIQVSWESRGRCHPNQKPITLLRYLISKVDAGVIIDPFMGSGTTLRAAKDLGRRCIGVEREEKYCEVAARRLSQEVLLL